MHKQTHNISDNSDDGSDNKGAGWNGLPPELIALMLNGSDAGGGLFLDPRHRFAARQVCRAWRRAVAHPTQAECRALAAFRPRERPTARACRWYGTHAWFGGRLLCLSFMCPLNHSPVRPCDWARPWLAMLCETKRASLTAAMAAAYGDARAFVGHFDALVQTLGETRTDGRSAENDWFDLRRVDPLGVPLRCALAPLDTERGPPCDGHRDGTADVTCTNACVETCVAVGNTTLCTLVRVVDGTHEPEARSDADDMAVLGQCVNDVRLLSARNAARRNLMRTLCCANRIRLVLDVMERYNVAHPAILRCCIEDAAERDNADMIEAIFHYLLHSECEWSNGLVGTMAQYAIKSAVRSFGADVILRFFVDLPGAERNPQAQSTLMAWDPRQRKRLWFSVRCHAWDVMAATRGNLALFIQAERRGLFPDRVERAFTEAVLRCHFHLARWLEARLDHPLDTRLLTDIGYAIVRSRPGVCVTSRSDMAHGDVDSDDDGGGDGDDDCWEHGPAGIAGGDSRCDDDDDAHGGRRPRAGANFKGERETRGVRALQWLAGRLARAPTSQQVACMLDPLAKRYTLLDRRDIRIVEWMLVQKWDVDLCGTHDIARVVVRACLWSAATRGDWEWLARLIKALDPIVFAAPLSTPPAQHTRPRGTPTSLSPPPFAPCKIARSPVAWGWAREGAVRAPSLSPESQVHVAGTSMASGAFWHLPTLQHQSRILDDDEKVGDAHMAHARDGPFPMDLWQMAADNMQRTHSVDALHIIAQLASVCGHYVSATPETEHILRTCGIFRSCFTAAAERTMWCRWCRPVPLVSLPSPLVQTRTSSGLCFYIETALSHDGRDTSETTTPSPVRFSTHQIDAMIGMLRNSGLVPHPQETSRAT